MSVAGPLRKPEAALLAEIKAAVGPQGWSEDAAELAPHLSDWRGLFHGRTPLLVRPATTEEVAQVVRLCAAARVPIVPQGGNTGLVGGATPSPAGDQILLNLARMNRVRGVDALNDTITVEAGCLLYQVQAAAAAIDRLFPLSLTAEGSCQIGGNLSTNAGGIAVLRYGNARDLVLGLEVVLPDGRVWDGLRALRKDNTGYDVKQLFIGAEGTLGIITAAVLKLFARPREHATAMAAAASLGAGLELLARIRAAFGETVTSFELMPRLGIDLALRHVPGAVDPLAGRHDNYLLIELAGARGLRGELESVLAAAVDDAIILDAVIAESEAQATGLWRLREAIVEGLRCEGAVIRHDIAVPVSRMPEFIERASRLLLAACPGVRPVPFGHLGDGNIHFNLTRPEEGDAAKFLARKDELTRLIHDLAAEFGGSISAEHGLGQLRREEIRRYKPAVEIELMRRIKAALDPDNIMNPGKVVS